MRFPFMRAVATAALIVGVFAGLAVSPAAATNIGNEGCTPGYWKNHTASWEEYATTDKLKFVFSRGTDLPFTDPATPADVRQFANSTMLDALNFKGGPGLA